MIIWHKHLGTPDVFLLFVSSVELITYFMRNFFALEKKIIIFVRHEIYIRVTREFFSHEIQVSFFNEKISEENSQFTRDKLHVYTFDE